MTSAEEVYDALAQEYYSDKHKTIRFFRGVQRGMLFSGIVKHAFGLNRKIGDIDILNLGSGPGQNRSDLCIYLQCLVQDRISDHRLHEVDISDAMLRKAWALLPDQTFYQRIEHTDRYPVLVKCDIAELDKYFKPGSYDMILALLCDHVQEQDKMYELAYSTLRPSGAFIVTYPHRELMTIIRREMLNTDIHHTVFEVDDKRHVLWSQPMAGSDLEQLFSGSGFDSWDCRDVCLQDGFYYQDEKVSPTVQKAFELSGRPVDKIPILAYGFGMKAPVKDITMTEELEKKLYSLMLWQKTSLLSLIDSC